MDANKPRTSDVPETPASRGRFALRNPVRAWSGALVITSVVYLVSVAVYLWLYMDQRAQPFALPRPAALGDFLAGVFSPLAFLWLVYGYFLQSAELDLQREEIAAMRKAQEESARELARAADAQEREAALADQAHRIGTEPELMIEHAGSRGDVVKLDIVNYGATARSLEFFSVSGGWNVTPSPLGGRALRTDERVRLELSNGGAPPDTGVNIELVYTSATDSTRRRKGFAITPAGKVHPFVVP